MHIEGRETITKGSSAVTSVRATRAASFARSVAEAGGYRWVGVSDVTRSDVILLGHSSDSPPASSHFSRESGLTGAAVTTGQPVFVNDVSRDTRYLTAFASTASEAIVPVLNEHGRVIGIIDVESDHTGAIADASTQLTLRSFGAEAASLFEPVTFRAVRAGDERDIAAIYAPYVLDSAISFEEEPPDAAEMVSRIAAVTSRYPWLVAELAGEVIGYAYGTVHRARPAYRWSTEVSVYVGGRVHGRGVGRRLYERLFEELQERGYYRAFAGATLPNDASVALHHSVGFQRIATFERIGFKRGSWHDVAWFARDLQSQPFSQPPAER